MHGSWSFLCTTLFAFGSSLKIRRQQTDAANWADKGTGGLPATRRLVESLDFVVMVVHRCRMEHFADLRLHRVMARVGVVMMLCSIQSEDYSE